MSSRKERALALFGPRGQIALMGNMLSPGSSALSAWLSDRIRASLELCVAIAILRASSPDCQIDRFLESLDLVPGELRDRVRELAEVSPGDDFQRRTVDLFWEAISK